MFNSRIINLIVKGIKNPEKFKLYNTQDLSGNPQLIINNKYYFTNNINEGKFYFSRTQIGAVLIVDRITKVIYYKHRLPEVDDGTMKLHIEFQSMCTKIVSKLTGYLIYNEEVINV